MATKDIVRAVASAEELEEWIAKSDKVLVVLDVHKSWCGPCTVMQPTFKRIFLEHDDAEKRLVFLTVDDSLITPALAEKVPSNPGCKPVFVVFKQRVIVAKIQGVNAPELISTVAENIFPIEEED